MRVSRALLVLSFSMLAGRVSAGQDILFAGPGGDPAAQGGAAVFVQGPFQGPEVGLVAVEPFESGRPVLDAPYSAEAVTEVSQVLADGNRIEHRTSATIVRDGRGRIRREHQAVAFGSLRAQSTTPLVTISDPATGLFVTLDQERQIARRVKMMAYGPAARVDFDVPVSVGMATGVAAGGLPGVRVGGPGGSPVASDVRTEQLGAREIEGVRAEGVKTTMVIKANAIGNQLPIEIVSERWYSPELQVVVMTRRVDPRFGETLYRLTNIVRAEPPSDLFDVPQGFRMEERRLGPPPRIEPLAR